MDATYTKLKFLGKGAYSKVYKVSTPTKDQVALKEIDISQGLEYVFIRELEILKNFTHPNIVALKNIIQKDNTLYVELELLEKSLYDLRGLLTHDEIVKFAFQICSALHFLHHNNIAHRDIKPENIMIKNGNAYLIDFNLSKHIHANQKRHTPKMTTAYYRAPEQLFDNETYDPKKIDMWGLGCVLLELFSGETLFEHRENKLYVEQKKFFMNYTKNTLASLVKQEFRESLLLDVIYNLIQSKKRATILDVLNFPIFSTFNKDIPRKVSKLTYDIKKINMTKQNIDASKKYIQKIYKMYYHDSNAVRIEKLFFAYLQKVGYVKNIKEIAIACLSIIVKYIHSEELETENDILTIFSQKLSLSQLTQLELEILQKLNYRVN